MEYIFIPIAMKKEAEILINDLQNKITKNLFGYEIITGELNKKNILVGISGVGSINMSGLIHVILLNYLISTILNFGTMGGYGNLVHKGDIFIVTDCLNTNSYYTKKTEKNTGICLDNYIYTVFDEGENHDGKFYKASDEIIQKIKNMEKNNFVFSFGKIGSGDCWNKEYDKIMYLNEKYNLVGEEMECIAIYQLAEKYNKKVIAIKGISNNEILGEEFDLSIAQKLTNFVEKVIEIL